MCSASRRRFDRIYRRAKTAEALSWHRNEPPVFLARAIAERPHTGRALDIGCGSGLFSVYLARAGYSVTALDFTERAIEMTRDRARAAGIKIAAVCTDVLDWASSERFDLILDSGCLHCLERRARQRYRDKLLSWLGDDGDFVLIHIERRHLLDWRPVGPRRIARGEIHALFCPPLLEMTYASQIHRVPLPIGPTVCIASHWFRRSRG